MPISPEYLPSELHYIIPLAEKHGSEARIAEYDRRLKRHVQYGETLSAKDIETLGMLYIAIRTNGRWPLNNTCGLDPNPYRKVVWDQILNRMVLPYAASASAWPFAKRRPPGTPRFDWRMN